MTQAPVSDNAAGQCSGRTDRPSVSARAILNQVCVHWIKYCAIRSSQIKIGSEKA